jgi:hypothetical protein
MEQLGHLLRFILEALGGMLSGLSGGSALIRWLIGTVLGFLALWVLVALFQRIGLVRRASQKPAPQREAIDWRRAAEEALAAGDLLRAIRALYRQLVASLMAKGWVPDRPGVTSGDCRRAVRNLPDIRSEVYAATRAFEEVVYGKRAPLDQDIEVLRSAETLVGGASG